MAISSRLIILCSFVALGASLRCYEGNVALGSNERTAEKECGGISSYCIQAIDKSTNQMKRYCSSFSDEHNMEERCPMTGCHWQSSKETFCCCQFDLCNEWKADGTEFKVGEMAQPQQQQAPQLTKFGANSTNPQKFSVPPPSYEPRQQPTAAPAPINRQNSEINLD